MYSLALPISILAPLILALLAHPRPAVAIGSSSLHQDNNDDGCRIVTRETGQISALGSKLHHHHHRYNHQVPRNRHKHHNWLFFLGGLKSIAAVVLLKIKIVLWLAAIVAIIIFTGKYLIGSADFPGFFKSPAPAHGLPPEYLSPYLNYNPDFYQPEIIHQPIYSYGASDHGYASHDSHENADQQNYINQEGYGNTKHNYWSQIETGGRSINLIPTSHADSNKILINHSNGRKTKFKKR